MKGFGIIEHGKKVGFLEKERPRPKALEALLEPVAISPCTSDVHSAFHRGANPAMNGRILGHEAVGRIVEIGEGVQDYQVGDVVAVPACTPDWRSLEVQDSIHQHSGGAFQGMKLSTGMDGVMADYFIVPDVERNTAKVPQDISLENALMAGDMVTTGLHGAELANIMFGDTVVVLGIGPVGLMAIAGSKLRGAGRIIAFGHRPACRRMAKDYGASDVLDYKEGAASAQVLELLGGKKADSAIICGGESPLIEECYRMTKPNGTIANLVGMAIPKVAELDTVAANRFVAHQKLVGGLCPGGRRRIERIFELYRHGRLDASMMITHKLYGLDSCQQAFDYMVEKPDDLVKPIVYMS